MKLKLNEVNSLAGFDVRTPEFDYEAVKKETASNPQWLHFGAGNIFRGYIARIYQDLLNRNEVTSGIIAAESYDFEVIEKIYKPHDNLALTVLMNSRGEFDKTVVASIVDSLTTGKDDGGYNKLTEIFKKESLQMASFTITEKGYALKNSEGAFFPFVVKDLENGPEQSGHIMCVLTSLMLCRYKNGAWPLALVSLDNCSHNGDKLKAGVITVAEEWGKRGFVDRSFIEYLKDSSKVSYPLSMIDKITPRPADAVKEHLEEMGFEEMDIVITSKNTYMAPFVNAETTEYLVIEDTFPNGRPPLEKAGVYFTDRERVNNVEIMKVTTCLNPLHTALAVTGCLLGYTLIADEMKDEDLVKLIRKIGYDEGLPVVLDPGIISPEKFIDEVVNERLPNPFIPDTPQRIASDTSQKVGIRFGVTIQSYMNDKDKDPANLTGIALAIAAWLRYLLAVDDEGNEFELSPDPMADELREKMAGITVGNDSADIKSVLSNREIFGCSLYDSGIGVKIEQFFSEMIAGKGGVRDCLKRNLA